MKRLVHSSALLALLVGLLTLGLVAPTSAATKTGTIKGVVTLGGSPVKGVKIELHNTGDDGFDYPVLATDTTDSKGAYSFKASTAIPEYYSHTVVVTDQQHRIVATSRRVTVKAGRTVTRNVTAKAAGSITGSVKRADGAATTRLRVDVFGPSAQIDPDRDLPLTYEESVPVAADGSYALVGLPDGAYDLRFADESGTYLPQCYDNQPESNFCDDGTTIQLGRGQDVTAGPQVLATKAGRISGTVTDTSGRPIRYVDVVATQDGGSFSDASSSTGAFSIRSLPSGTYRLSASAPSPWASVGNIADVDVTPAGVSGVQIELKSRASVKATLTPGKGTVKVAVDVTRSATGAKPSGTVKIHWGSSVSKTVSLVKGKGTATLSGLPKGKRRITVDYSGTSSTAATTATFHAVVK